MKTLAASIFTLAITLMAAMFVYTTYLASASVITGGEYQAQSVVDATSGTSTIRTMGGSVGSIIVENSSAAASLVLYDTASTTIATTSATVLLDFDVAASEGTYQYDIRYNNGLLLDVGGAFDGDIVITYR